MPRPELTLDPDHTVLVIVECQNGVVGPDSALPGLAEAAAPVLPVIGRLARAARKAGVRVVHLTCEPVFDGRSAGGCGARAIARAEESLIDLARRQYGQVIGHEHVPRTADAARQFRHGTVRPGP